MAANDKMLELFSDMNGKIGELVAEIRAILVRLEKGDKKLEEHENRLDRLELAAKLDKESRKAVSGGEASQIDFAGFLMKYGGWIVAGLVGIIMKLVGATNVGIPN